jgi:hypothetical protein
LAGEQGEVSVYGTTDVREVDLPTIRAEACIKGGLQFDMYAAARLYKSQSWDWATHLYQWVQAVATANSTTCQAVPGTQALTQEAGIYLNQLSIGLDFWGHSFDHVPLLTYDEILATTHNMLLIAEQAEIAFDKYAANFTDHDERENVVSDSLKNAEFMISTHKETLSQTIDRIQATKTQVKALELERTLLDQRLSTSGEECDAEIRRKTADEHYAWGPTFNRLVNFISKTVTVGLAFYTSFGLAAAAVQSIFSASSALLSGFANDAAGAASQPTFSGVQHLLISGAVPVVNTLITNTQQVSNTVQGQRTDLATTLQEIDGMWKEGSTLMDSTIRNVRAQRHQDAIMEWLKPLPSCTKHFPDLELAATLAQQHDALVAAHDEDVVKYAQTQMQIVELEQQRIDIASEAAGSFDPSLVSVAMMVSKTYTMLKDDIIRSLKDLNGAMNYQFCTSEEFTYESERVVQLQSVYAQTQAQYRRLVEADSMSRTMVADFPDFQSFDAPPTATTIFTFTAAEHGAIFEQFYTQGKLIFNIGRDNAALPLGASNMRVASVQAYSPQLKPAQSEIAEIFIKRQGVSECKGADGIPKTFAHGPRTYTAMYNHNKPKGKWLTGRLEQSTRQEPTPVGAWELSMAQLENEAQRRAITSVELHLVISFVPCLNPDCSKAEI